MRVPAARVRQHEHLRAVNLQSLRSRALHLRRNRACLFVVEHERKDGPPQRDAHQRDDRGPVARDLFLQDPPSIDILGWLEHVDARRRPRHEIGDPNSQLWQSHVVFVGKGFGDQPRFPEKLPETVRRAGEVMPGLRRSNARVDADEKDADGRPDAIAEGR